MYGESTYQLFGNVITIFNHIGDIIISNNKFKNIVGIGGTAIKILTKHDTVVTKFGTPSEEAKLNSQ